MATASGSGTLPPDAMYLLLLREHAGFSAQTEGHGAVTVRTSLLAAVVIAGPVFAGLSSPQGFEHEVWGKLAMIRVGGSGD